MVFARSAVLQRHKWHVPSTRNDLGDRVENEQGYVIVSYLLYLRDGVEGLE